MHSSDAFIPQYGEVVTTAFGFRPNAKRYKRWSPKRNGMSAASFASNFTGQHYRRRSQEYEESVRSKNCDHGREKIPYDQSDATGFIRLNALRIKLRAAIQSRDD